MSETITQPNANTSEAVVPDLTSVGLIESLLSQLGAEYRGELEKLGHIPACLEVNGLIVTHAQYVAFQELLEGTLTLIETRTLLLLAAGSAALNSAATAFVEAAQRLHTDDWQPLRYELQLGRAALKSEAGEKLLKVIEAARDHRDAARLVGADETGGRTLKALITAVDELDVF